MKRLLLLCVIFGVYHNWPLFSDSNTHYSEDNVVVLYATDWCGYCKKARQFFSDNNIEYQEFDIEKSDEGRRRYDELGGQGIPLVHVNGNVIKGYNKSKILQYLH